MSNEQARGFIQQASQSIQSGQFGQALELADQAIALDPADPEAHVLRGVALSSTNQPEAAVDAFRRAISLDPKNTKAFYNLAIHYYRIGQKVEALEMAREVVNQDPAHAGGRELVTRIETEANAQATVNEGRTPDGMYAAPPAPGGGPEYRPGYDERAGSGIAFIQKMGAAWTIIGWVMIAYQAVAFFLSMPQLIQVGQLMMAGKQEELQRLSQQAQASAGPAQQILGWVIFALMLLWFVLDIAHRRGNWLWLVPFIICCCVNWLIAGIYMLAGRK